MYLAKSFLKSITMKTLIFTSAFFFFCISDIYSQNTYVPDDNFEQALIDLGYDSGPLDDYVPTANISGISFFSLYNLGINDLTGIQDFAALSNFTCASNNLTTIDLSQNANLITFSCSSNNLISLDLSGNPSLVHLDFQNNAVTSIDLTVNINLGSLWFNNNDIDALDVSNNSSLYEIYANYNMLSTLPIGTENISSLTTLSLESNNISGCWPEEYSSLCSQLTNFNFELNTYNGTTDFISNQGWIDFCNSQTGECPCDHPDYAALEALYNSTGGANWTNNTGWLQDCDPCGIVSNTPWHGITCFGNSEVVTEINLNGNNLVGPIPPEIGDLISLDLLSLEGNNLGGTIPTEIGDLQFLEELRLGACQLTGSMPASICNLGALTYLNLGINQMSGTLPTCLEDLIFLEFFNVRNNSFSGALPNFDADQTALDWLATYNNNFTGPIPPGYGGLTPSILQLDNCNLSGDYAPELGALCDFGFTNASISAGNSFNQNWEDFCNVPCAYVPDDNFELALQALGYDSGPLDDCVSILNIETVLMLDVSGEGIEDLTGIEFFAALETLDCSNNDLIFIDINDNTALTCLNASNNMINCFNIAGDILSNLTEFFVQNNNIAGCWPEDMSNLCGVTNYNFEGNYYDGTDNFISNVGWSAFCSSGAGTCLNNWEGWSNLDEGVNGSIISMVVSSNDELFVGGNFNMAGNVSALNIAKWDGSNWSNIGTGLEQVCYSLIFYNNQLVAGGDFGVKYWNGSQWNILGDGLIGHVDDLAINSNGDLYAAGFFRKTGSGLIVNRIAILNDATNSWAPLIESSTSLIGVNGQVNCIEFDFNDILYLGGSFSAVGSKSASKIATWNSATNEWSDLLAGITNGRVHNLTLNPSSGDLYVVGNITRANHIFVNDIAKWDGVSWSNVGNSNNWPGGVSTIHAVEIYNNEIYVTGAYTSPSFISKFNSNSSWENIGSGLNNRGFDIDFDSNGNLYAGGLFSEAGDQPANRVAKYQLCQDDMIITCEIPDGSYSAGTMIQTTAPVIDLDDVTLSAPTIILNPGFSVEAGSQFQTSNTGCN